MKDPYMFEDGRRINFWWCQKCKRTVSKRSEVNIETTLGHYGPNGNGWNYWHIVCDYRLEPKSGFAAMHKN